MKGKKVRRCSLCGAEFIGYGNNPYPFRRISNRCCDDCYQRYIVPANLKLTYLEQKMIADKDEQAVLKYFTNKYKVRFNGN